MRLQNTSRVHDATVWRTKVDAHGRQVLDNRGQPQYHDPENVKVFWIDKQQIIAGKNGQQMQSRCMLIVGESIPFESFFYRGLKETIPDLVRETPKSVEGAYQVIGRDRYENRKRQVAHIVYL